MERDSPNESAMEGVQQKSLMTGNAYAVERKVTWKNCVIPHFGPIYNNMGNAPAKIEKTLRENAKVETKNHKGIDACDEGVEVTVAALANKEIMNTPVKSDQSPKKGQNS